MLIRDSLRRLLQLQIGAHITDLVAGRSFPRAESRLSLRALDFGLWTLDFGLWTLDFGLWTLDFGLWTFWSSATRRGITGREKAQETQKEKELLQ